MHPCAVVGLQENTVSSQKYKIRVTDIFYILVTVGCVGLFFYLNRGM